MVALTILATLGCGLVAGIFFAFSTFIMKALGQISPVAGIRAMQSINVVVLNPWFFSAFFGTSVVCVVLLIQALFDLNEARAVLQLSGSVLYLAGTILVTILFNVPRNQRLAGVASEDPESDRLWKIYVLEWTFWNHVRTVAALAAAALFCMVLVI